MNKQVESAVKQLPQTVWLTKKEVADYFRISSKTVDRLAKIKKLPIPLRLGGICRWRLTDVEDFINKQHPQANSTTGPPAAEDCISEYTI